MALLRDDIRNALTWVLSLQTKVRTQECPSRSLSPATRHLRLIPSSCIGWRNGRHLLAKRADLLLLVATRCAQDAMTPPGAPSAGIAVCASMRVVTCTPGMVQATPVASSDADT